MAGLDSTRLLAEVVERSRRRGWRVVNCDVIIHAQEPKLGPHKPAIRANLARLLRVGETAVNVKAKTGEHVGPVGRAEAISCQAVCARLEPRNVIGWDCRIRRAPTGRLPLVWGDIFSDGACAFITL